MSFLDLGLDFDSSSLSPVDSEWTDSGYAGKDDQDTLGSYHCGEPAELFLDESMSIKETYEYCKASKYDIHKYFKAIIVEYGFARTCRIYIFM